MRFTIGDDTSRLFNCDEDMQRRQRTWNSWFRDFRNEDSMSFRDNDLNDIIQHPKFRGIWNSPLGDESSLGATAVYEKEIRNCLRACGISGEQRTRSSGRVLDNHPTTSTRSPERVVDNNPEISTPTHIHTPLNRNFGEFRIHCWLEVLERCEYRTNETRHSPPT